jgi:predicted nuclease of predicted toxin-antitoxin system
LTIWEYAHEHALTIVTKDADFGEMTVVTQSPPKVIWIRTGNCATSEIETLLISSHDAITAFETGDEAVLVLC